MHLHPLAPPPLIEQRSTAEDPGDCITGVLCRNQFLSWGVAA
ncbi:hypothetical protein AB0N79_37860 [Streptomyces microflavus]